jgi:hypothetical protein
VTERQKLLAEKLAANGQRLLWTPYLNALPATIRAELEPARFLCVPDDAAVRRHSYVSARGVRADSPALPTGFAFREFSWPEQVYAAVAAYTDRHDSEPGLFRPFQVRRFLGQTTTELFGELPTFTVRFGWARQHLPALFEASLNGVALVSESFRAGIVLHVVIGYLEPDPNPAERIYELGTWG